MSTGGFSHGRAFVATSVSALALLLCSSCSAPKAQDVLQSSNRMKELILGFRNYQAINGDWPQTLEQIRELTETDLDVLMKNPVTGDNPGYEYVPPATDADPATTVVLYQLRDGQRDTSLRVGYADGRVASAGSE